MTNFADPGKEPDMFLVIRETDIMAILEDGTHILAEGPRSDDIYRSK